MRGYYELIIEHLDEKLFFCRSPIWEFPAEVGKEQNSGCIQINRWPEVKLLFDDLRRHIGRRAAVQPRALRVRDLRAEAEVNQLDVVVGVKHYVLQLDVAVSDSSLVQVGQS